MGALNPFSKPKVPSIPSMPQAPTVENKQIAPTTDNSQADIQAAQDAQAEQLKKQKGRAATILTSGRGVVGDDSSSGLATKTLLG